jgi:hypothetical protein
VGCAQEGREVKRGKVQEEELDSWLAAGERRPEVKLDEGGGGETSKGSPRAIFGNKETEERRTAAPRLMDG